MARRTDTRDRVLDTAAELLQRQGYSATGLNQVLAESGAPKGSLYFHFPGGKEQLAAEAVRRSGDQMAREMAEVVMAAASPADALEGLARLFAGNLESSGFHRGCPVATVALEAAADSEAIRVSCAEVYASWVSGLEVAMQGWGVPEDERARLADLIVSSLQGAILLARVRQDTGVVHSVAAQLAAQVTVFINSTRGA